MTPPILVIFSGLPGTGKTSIARLVARSLGAAYVRADAIEHVLSQGGVQDIGGLGYQAGMSLASENLRLGLSVVADSVNPWPLTRGWWREPAQGAGVPWLDVEVVCSDQAEHRRRVETRLSDIPGFVLPRWEEVLSRDWQPWDDGEALTVDSCVLSPEEAAERVAAEAQRRRGL